MRRPPCSIIGTLHKCGGTRVGVIHQGNIRRVGPVQLLVLESVFSTYGDVDVLMKTTQTVILWWIILLLPLTTMSIPNACKCVHQE